MIFGFGDQQASEQRANDRRQAGCGGRQAGQNDDQQADREKQFRALGPCRLRENPGQQQTPEDQHADDDGTAHQQGLAEIIPAAVCGYRRRYGAEQKDDRDNGNILEQQHSQRRAADRAFGPGHRQHKSGRGQRQSESESERTGSILADQIEDGGDDQSRGEQFGCTDAEDQPAQGPEPLE